ncbi:sensor histidine kinase [Dyadobacter psychrotolerans]|nr:ATP-binding protein [Dyadobacter psychrotolerans]
MERYIVKQYTDDSGLPQNSVKNVAGDKDGFIWLTTEGGLVRYDGQRFYTFDKSNLPISESRFYIIQPSLKGPDQNILYAGSDGAEFVRIENGRAVVDPDYYSTKINKLPFIKDGYQFTYLASGTPSLLNSNASQKHYVIPTGQGEGNFYICDFNQITHYRNWQKKSQTRYTRPNFLNYFTIGQRLFYFESDGTFSRIDQDSVARVKIEGAILKEPGVKNLRDGSRIYWNHASDQVFMYVNGNLYLVKENGKGELDTSLLLRKFDLVGRNIHCIYFSKSGNTLFLGSMTQGLFVLAKQLFEPLTTKGSEEENVFYAQTAFEENAVLTPRGIILGKNKETGQVFERKLNPVIASGDDGRSMLTDQKKFLYIKAGEFLNRFDASGKKLLNRWDLKDEIKQIYADTDETIWIGLKNMGLYSLRYNEPTDEPQLFQKEPFFRVSFIQSKKPGILLVGTEKGLFEANLDTKKAKLIPGTKGVFIKSIYVSNPGEIWITTREDGLFLYLNDKIVRLPLDNNKYLSGAHCIVEDQNGFLWLPTNKGLFQAQKRDLLHYANLKIMSDEKRNMTEKSEALPDVFYQYYNKDYGFLTNEFNGGCTPCAVRLSGGYLSFPSLKGLIWFKPEEITAPLPNALIFLDRMEHSEGLVSSPGDTVHLPVNPQRINFHFSTPYFGNIENLSLSYILSDREDIEPELARWIPISGHELTVSFSSLGSGEHILYIKKKQGFGLNNVSIKKIRIIVPPLWYETWWARVSFLLILFAAVYGYNLIRLYQIRQKNRRLELQIIKRTRILNRTLSELEVSQKEVNRQLYMMSRLLTSMTHDIQSPLNYLMLTSGKIPELIEKGNLSMVSEIGEVISQSSRHMSGLMKDLLDYIKTHVYGKSMKFEDINLKSLVESKYEVFKSATESEGNRFVNLVPDNFIVFSDYQMLAIMIHNLMDNATKFTKGGFIQISAEIVKGRMNLTVSNSGIPMPAEQIQMFNEEGKDFNPSSTIARKTGLGLLIIKEIAVLINVRLSVSQTDTTDFRLIFNEITSFSSKPLF